MPERTPPVPPAPPVPSAARLPTPPRGAPALLLAFDVGARRIGVARGDTVSRTAAPAGILEAHGGVPRAGELERLLRDWRPDRLLVGLPYNVDGTESAQSARAREFAAQLAARFALPVDLVDERYSSLEAQARLKQARASGARRRRVAKADVDAGAACIILERWLAAVDDSRRGGNQP